VSPGNPTGALLSPGELAFLEGLCQERALSLVGDEVFRDTAEPGPSVASASRCLAFHLGGLSKTCGLPQLKAAWIAAAGPDRLVAPALERLDLAADVALSVSGPSQLALPRLLARRERFLGPLRERLRENRAALSGLARDAPFDLLRSGGGWSAVLRIGEALDEEALCLALLDDGVAVQPGFFYDFERSGYLVLSLLPEPAAFRTGLTRLRSRLGGRPVS
jgi:aspartate/methionine/tyrosine aminotransferase